jgi:hypothetical protein
MESEQTNELNAALAKAQAVMKAAPFDKVNPHFKSKYATLASVVETIRKPLADNGLSYTQTTVILDTGLVLLTKLRHTSGQWVASEYPLRSGLKPQEMGSEITYARRYSLSSIVCIAADEDDDAEIAHKAPTAVAKESPIKPQTVAPPVHPETGEVSPHEITAPNAVAYGQLVIAAVNVARDASEVFQWQQDNKTKLSKLEKQDPKIHGLVMAAVNAKLATFKQEAA